MNCIVSQIWYIQTRQSVNLIYINKFVQKSMMTNKQYPSHFGYVSQRLITSKLNTSSPTSGSSYHQHFQNSHKEGKSKNKSLQTDQLNLIYKQNNILKEENRILKKQLNFYRTQNAHNFNLKQGKSQVNDLRQTIKKEAGEIKDLKTRLQVLSKQCKMYEDVIDKMEGKINKLIQQNKYLQNELNSSKYTSQTNLIQETSKTGLNTKQNNQQKTKLQYLTNRVNQFYQKYADMEAHIQNSDAEWNKFIQQWGREKTYYLHRIKDLQDLMGINMNINDKNKYKKKI